ncbi:MAG TPA: cytochrome c peroxidase [Aquabacterium sp.]|nr:cytochrome c peroxidase [Aquabacterium sp.]
MSQRFSNLSRVSLVGGLLTSMVLVTLALASPAFREPWSDAEKAVIASLGLKRLPAPPNDPSNAVEGVPAAIGLGKKLFHDQRASRNGAVACASCHDPSRQFQDGLAVGRGVGVGSRRTMPIIGAAYSTWLFWDGRKDSLWAQALGPLEDAHEHGGNRARYAHFIADHYRQEYEALFGSLPDLKDIPLDAGPLGNEAERAAWAKLTPRDRTAISTVFANLGKAIAAYEKSLRPQPSRLDRYIDALTAGDASASRWLEPAELRGLRLFIGKGQCVSCHNGPLFTDQQFHNTGVPPRLGAKADRGRAAATEKVLADEFNCLGPFSDAPPASCRELRFMVTNDSSLEGAFKTPGLRGVALRAPYMHAGQFQTLDQVVRHYVQAPHASVGHSGLTHQGGGAAHDERAAARVPIQLTEDEIADLVHFLSSLDPVP